LLCNTACKSTGSTGSLHYGNGNNGCFCVKNGISATSFKSQCKLGTHPKNPTIIFHVSSQAAASLDAKLVGGYPYLKWTDGKYHPICGHYFWDKKRGADLFCKRAGYSSGGKFGQRGGMFETDAIRVGKCRSSDTDIRNCHGGGNAYSSVATSYCGARVNGRRTNIGQKVVCYGNKIGVAAAPSQCTGEVSLYQHGGFNGKEVKFGKGNYNHGAMTRKGQKNDDVSSLKVPNGCRAILYQHNFDGYGIEFGPGNYNHGAMTQRGVRNDDVSSLKVD